MRGNRADRTQGLAPKLQLLLLVGIGIVLGSLLRDLLSTPSALYAQSNSPLTIQPDTGRVGIGTTNPAAKLDVAGDIRANNIWMKIAEMDISASPGVSVTGLNGNVQKMYRVVFQGSLSAGGQDRRVLIRPNGVTTGYKTLAVMDGDAGLGERDFTGFYVGRNGWALDADIAFEYTLSALTGRKRLYVEGSANFSLSNGAVLGFGRHGGHWSDTTSNITSLWLGPSGGTITGKLLVFALQ